MTDPYDPAELELLLPPIPTGTPAAEVMLDSENYLQAFVLDSGKVESFESSHPLELGADSISDVIIGNIELLTSGRHWKLAQVCRMVRQLARNQITFPDDALSKVKRKKRSISAEELFWLALIFEVPIWDLLAPQEGNLVNLYGNRLRDRDGVLVTLTHLSPSWLSQTDTEAFSAGRREAIRKQRIQKKESARRAVEANPSGVHGDSLPDFAVRVEHSSELVRDAEELEAERDRELRRTIKTVIDELGLAAESGEELADGTHP